MDEAREPRTFLVGDEDVEGDVDVVRGDMSSV
jgi:hypothetical protein